MNKTNIEFVESFAEHDEHGYAMVRISHDKIYNLVVTKREGNRGFIYTLEDEKTVEVIDRDRAAAILNEIYA